MACSDPTSAPIAATQLTVSDGDRQTGAPGYLLEHSIEVRVDDANGLAVPGAEVHWSVDERGASVSPSVSHTDANGRATTRWRLGTDEGEQRAFAVVGSLPGAIFNASALSGDVTDAGGPAAHQCGRYTDDIVRCWMRPGDAPARAIALDTDQRFTTLTYAVGEWCGGTRSNVVACVRLADIIPGGQFRPDAAPVRVLAPGVPGLSELTGGGDPELGATWCAIAAADSRLYCWGENGFGQVGDGTLADRISPVPVQPEFHARSVTIVGNATCALDLAGLPWCWGATSDKVVTAPEGITAVSNPVTVQTQRRFSSIVGSTGGSVCALDFGLEIFCWGGNRELGLGRGFANATSTPAPILAVDLFLSIGASGDGFLGITTERDAVIWGGTPVGGSALPVHVLYGIAFNSVLPGGGDGAVCLRAQPVGTRCLDRNQLPATAEGANIPVYGIPRP